MNILLFNTGSSSLKFSVLNSDDASIRASGSADWAGEQTCYCFTTPNTERSEEVDWLGPANAVDRVLRDLREHSSELFSGPDALAAVGHRVVHGGGFREATRITPAVRDKLTELCQLAPLHNPPGLEAIDAATTGLPDLPHVACFDTAFHHTMIPEAQTYPIPHEWTEQWKIRRYGFHGLSHSYCSARANEMLKPRSHPLRLVICHLGHGCSASAVRDGQCVETTMGFTPLEGLMMATRSGSIDPSVPLHLMQQHELTANEIGESLNRRSGMLGVSGISADMRTVLKSAHDGHERAKLAIAMYCHRVRQTIGGFAATLGGIDALVFTAGVGEHSAEVRSTVSSGLEYLGLHLDSVRNLECLADADISPVNSPGRILVIRTREDLSMLRMTIQNVQDCQ
ncbi:MAG: acetate/propionate family kinase [Fuerstiella sp.]